MASSVLKSSAGQVFRSASAIVSRPVSGSHVLRIDGYSHLKEVVRHGESIDSCTFDVGGHSWRLLCFPNGSHSKFRRQIALYLQLVSDPEGGLVRAQSQFSLLDQRGEPVLLRDTGLCNFSSETSQGFKDLISRTELEKSEYLKDDRFAIQCNVSVTTVRKCNGHWAFVSQDLKSHQPTAPS